MCECCGNNHKIVLIANKNGSIFKVGVMARCVTKSIVLKALVINGLFQDMFNVSVKADGRWMNLNVTIQTAGKSQKRRKLLPANYKETALAHDFHTFKFPYAGYLCLNKYRLFSFEKLSQYFEKFKT